MAFTVNNDGIYRVTVRGKWNSVSDVQNVFQVRLVDGGPLTMNEFGNHLADRFTILYDLVKLFCDALMIWNDIVYSGLDGNQTAGPYLLTGPPTGVGTGQPYALGVAALATFPTGVKRVVLRKYFGVLNEDFVGSNGNLTSGAFDDLQDVADEIVTPYSAGGITSEIGYFSPKTLTWEVPYGGRAVGVPAYQRRRRPGAGS